MMKRNGNWIAVALVATALCADRAIAAAPELPQPQTSATPGLVSRLTTGLRRSISSVRIYQPQQESLTASPLAASRIAPLPLIVSHPALSPFQFRLPPPQK
jgi:hypothetical protein